MWLDSIDWWSRHAYLLNVVSGLTGVCFGVPFAVVGLDYLNRAQEEARQAERARARIGAQVIEFRSSLLTASPGRNLADLITTAEALRNQINDIRLMHDDDPARSDAIATVIAYFDRLMPSRGGHPRTSPEAFVLRSGDLSFMMRWRTQVKTRWEAFYVGGRPELAEGWLADDTEIAAHHAVEQVMSNNRHPWKGLRGISERAWLDHLRYFLEDLIALCRAGQALEVYV